MLQEERGNVVLLPTHKSFMDLWILGMINLDEGIEFPFSYGEQSMMKLALLDTILKKSGTFKINPGLKNDEFFRAVLNSYVHALLKND